MRLCVMHNLYFYNKMMEEIRDALDAGDLAFLRAFERPRSGPVFWLKYQRLIHGAARKAGMLALC